MPRQRRKTFLRGKWPKHLPNGDVFYAYKIGRDYWASIHRISQHGFKWVRCNGARQRELDMRREKRNASKVLTGEELEGTEVTNERLSERLQTRTVFTALEWKSFGVRAVSNDFICVKGVYFEPMVEDLQVACTASKYEKALEQSFADRELAQRDKGMNAELFT